LFGGAYGGDKYRIYDLKKRLWRECVNMPKKRNCGGSAIDTTGKIYVYGGYWNAFYKDMVVFDHEQNEWIRGPDMPAVNRWFAGENY